MNSWKPALAIIAGVTIVVDLVMVLIGMEPSVMLVASLGGALGIGVWFIADLMGVSIGSTGVPVETVAAPSARGDRRVTRLRSGLAYGRSDRASLERLHGRLVDLIMDQLRAEHHLDVDADPGAGRAALDRRLWEFIDDPDAARDLSDPDELDRILTLIEQI